jgi:hypothetical protein
MKNKKFIDEVIKIIGFILNNKKILYLSMPMTSIEAIKNKNIIVELIDKTKKYMGPLDVKNAQNKKGFLNKIYNRIADNYIKLHSDKLIVNPMLLKMQGWEQKDYHYFWGEVIRRHAEKVIFFPGWEYSNGCTYEFLVAKRHNIGTYDLMGNKINISKGIKMIEEALNKINLEKEKLLLIEKNLKELEKLAGNKKR